MSAYEALLFLHVTSVAFWLGAELLVAILVRRAERQGEPAAMRRLFDEFNALDPIFMPTTLVVLATGIALVIDGPWSFGSLWIVIALAGVAFIYLYGFGYLQPQVNRLQAMSEGEAATGPEAQALEGAIAPIECISQSADGALVCAREADLDHVCPTKLLWTRVQHAIVQTLQDTTLADLAAPTRKRVAA